MQGEIPIRFTSLVQLYKTLFEGDSTPVYHNEVTRCGMGTTSVGVSFDGTLNPCQEENSTKKYEIGDVFRGIDFEKRNQYLKKYFDIMTNLSCDKHCPRTLRYTCFNSLCPNSLIGDAGKISEAKCIYNRTLYQTAQRLFQNCRLSIFPNIREYLGGE